MTQTCIVCATRNRTTQLDTGHCCPTCHTQLDRDLASIITNADLAAANTPTTRGNATSTGYESKPPTDLDALAPYQALVRLNPGQTPALHRSVANLVCDWEKELRDLRQLTPYGPATAHHTGTTETHLAAQATRQAINMLRAHLDWITSTPDWPLDDFADEIRRCAKRMHAYAHTSHHGDRIVTCPTLTETPDGQPTTCGQRLTVHTWAALDPTETTTGRADWTIGEPVHCPRCGTTRNPEQLLRAAGKEDTWADPEAIATWYGISERTLRRWAANGHIRRDRGMYALADIETHRDTQRTGA